MRGKYSRINYPERRGHGLRLIQFRNSMCFQREAADSFRLLRELAAVQRTSSIGGSYQMAFVQCTHQACISSAFPPDLEYCVRESLSLFAEGFQNVCRALGIL